MTTNTVPAWTCPRCGTTHPITVTKCCGPKTVPTFQTPPQQIPPHAPICLHDSCPDCKNGTCSGVHMISCPCPKCSPRC